MKLLVFFISFCFSFCLFGQNWEKEYSDALSNASEKDKPIILVFAGSDWCGPCIKLDKDIWKSEEFKEYSQTNYVLYKADFPRKRKNQLSESVVKSNALLAERFNPKGYFPLVVVLNKNEKLLGATGFKKLPPNDYISLLNSFLE